MKRGLSMLLLLVLVLSVCTTALAARPKLPDNVNPKQLGHPGYLSWLYGEKRAKQILKDYGAPQLYESGNLLVIDDNDTRDGSLSHPFVFAATAAGRYYVGAYVTTMNIIYKIQSIESSAGRTMLRAYECNSNGVVISDVLHTLTLL